LPKKLGLCVAMHYKWQSALQYNLNWIQIHWMKFEFN
jgi:hypothetical protein